MEKKENSRRSFCKFSNSTFFHSALSKMCFRKGCTVSLLVEGGDKTGSEENVKQGNFVQLRIRDQGRTM
jgi:hypothetical protein